MSTRNTVLVALLTLTILAGAPDSRQATAQTSFGPGTYQAYDDPAAGANISPFAAIFGPIVNLDDPGGPAETTSVHDFRGLSFPPSGQYFYLEDFQDGQYDSPGATVSGNISAVRIDGGINGAANDAGMDGVDEDNTGGVDGDGKAAVQGILRSNNPGGPMIYDFDAAALGGNLPTYAGAVGGENGDMRIKVYAADDTTQLVQLDASVTHNPTSSGLQPQFLGYYSPDGIGKIELLNNWEYDHVQYGFVPEPSSFIISGLSLLGFMGFALRGWGRRRNRG